MRVSILEACLLLSSLGNIGLGLFVLHGRRLRADIAGFVLIALGIGGWVGSFALLSITHLFAFDTPNHLSGLVFILGLFIVSQVFPKGELRRGRFLWAYVPIIAALVIVLSGGVVERVEFGPNGSIVPIQGPFFGVYAGIIVFYLIWSLVLLVRSLKKASDADAMRMKYFFAGIIIFVCGAGLGDVLLPALGFTHFNILGPFASVIFVAMTSLAIAKHRLLDIRIVLQRGLVYSLMAALLGALYMIFLGLISLSVDSITHTSPIVAAGITMVIGVFTAVPLEQYLRRKTDKIFFTDRYEYRDAMKVFTNVFVTSTTFDELVEGLEIKLASIFRSSGSRLELHEDPRIPAVEEKNFSEPNISIILGDMEIGNIIPGPKRSGREYSKEDIELLETLALHTAAALERVRLYQKVRHHAEILEERVRERTAELVAREEREHQMLADISHNLQTPLTVLQTKLDRLHNIRRAHKEIESFQTSLGHLSSFIYDLLKFSRLENSAIAENETLSLTKLLRDAAEEIRVIAESSGVSVHTSISSHISVSGNAKQLTEVIMNLASNALKHTKGRKISRVTLRLRSSRDRALISVSDTGTGISKEDLNHVFERYYSTKKRGIGTGLGLAITKKIVENHGGTIEIESRLGKGTKVTLSFPIIRASSSTSGPQAS